MHNDQFQGGQSPFLEQIETSLFFPAGGREKVRNQIVKAITDGVAIITLVGEEGSGKTHLSQMVFADIPDGYCPVYLPESLESYENVVRIVAQELDISLRDQEEFGGTANLLQAILGILEERKEKLVLIYDQAEKIYLATLERIRKMLDQANKQQVRVQVLLTGRTALLDNLQQLTLCTFEGTQERHFNLRPLRINETYSYLNYCMQAGTGGEEKEVFARDAAEKIYSMANGNFRMTNILADEALQSLNSDTSFMVLLENVGGAESRSGKRWKGKGLFRNLGGIFKKLGSLTSIFSGIGKIFRGGAPVSFKGLMAQKEWLVAGGGGLLVLFLLLIMVFSGEDQEAKDVASDQSMNIEFKEVDEVPPADTEEDYQPPTEEEAVAIEPPQEVIPVPEVVPEKEMVAETPESTESTESTENDLLVTGDLTEREDVAEVQEPVVQKQPETDEVPEQKAEDAPVVALDEKPESAEVVSAPKEEVAEVEQGRKEPTREVTGSRIHVEPLTSFPQQRKIPVLGGHNVSKKIQKSLPVSDAIDKIYARRIVASAKWWVEQDGRYTIQLMSLKSDQAEKNLKKILQDDKYRAVSNDLYILRKTTAPLSVLVFYGEYKTMKEARSASLGLPVFLKKHQPYAISVAGAVKKANSS
jgi:type II secretory pathway predicted ATPase ExeA/septal ring-binding cell division protein DamX